MSSSPNIAMEIVSRDFFEAQRATANAVASRYDEQIQTDIKRADLWGKAVLALGTALLGAFGIGELADVLPLQDDWHRPRAMALLALAITAIGLIGYRLSKVGTPLVVRASIEDMVNAGSGGLRRREKHLVETVYQRFSHANGVTCPTEYAAIAAIIEITFTELADHGVTADMIPALTQAQREEHRGRIRATLLSPDTPIKLGHRHRHEPCNNKACVAQRRARLVDTYLDLVLSHPLLALQKSALVRSELRCMMSNAHAAVVRRRAVNATTDWLSAIALGAIAVGIVGATFLTFHANAPDAIRSLELQRSKTCAEIAGVLAEHNLSAMELPPACP
ncbi:MAG: hypothetical protein ABWY45_10120 [Mycobacterium sp.]